MFEIRPVHPAALTLRSLSALMPKSLMPHARLRAAVYSGVPSLDDVRLSGAACLVGLLVLALLQDTSLLVALPLAGFLAALYLLDGEDVDPSWCSRLLWCSAGALFVGIVLMGSAATSALPLLCIPVMVASVFASARELQVAAFGVLTAAALLLTLYAPAGDWAALGWCALVLLALVLMNIVATALRKHLNELVQARASEHDLLREAAVLRDAAQTDALTLLPNRRAFDESAPRILARSAADGVPLTLALLDLDHFKSFNDTHGHQAGDELLRAAASSWQQHVRALDLLARYGGEEFVVLLPGMALEDAERALNRLRVATPSEQTVSVGLAELHPEDSLHTLVARADAALYRAKGDGRNCVAVATRPASVAPSIPTVV